jgi:hypothetical protein
MGRKNTKSIKFSIPPLDGSLGNVIQLIANHSDSSYFQCSKKWNVRNAHRIFSTIIFLRIYVKIVFEETFQNFKLSTVTLLFSERKVSVPFLSLCRINRMLCRYNPSPSQQSYCYSYFRITQSTHSLFAGKNTWLCLCSTRITMTLVQQSSHGIILLLDF